jgi:small subunit ribosomal protein S17
MARTIVGTVTSNKTDKTIVVTVQARKTHPLYRKQYTVNTKHMAHDEKNEAEVGDKVMIVECRPLSAKKRFMLQEILEKPELREDSLQHTKASDEASKPDSKSKTGKESDEATPAAPTTTNEETK